MDQSELTSGFDRLLVPFLAARDPEVSRNLLGDLIELHLSPVIRGIIGRKLHFSPGKSRDSQDAEDLFGEAVSRLLERLQTLWEGCLPLDSSADGPHGVGSAQKGISNLRGYAATIAYSVCDEYLRRKYPERRRLKNRVQYLLTHRPEFGLWEMDDGEWYGGRSAWSNRRSSAGSGETLGELQEKREEFERKELAGREARREGPTELIAAVFRWVGGPVELDTLVNLLRELWEIHEEEVRAEEDEEALERRVAHSDHRPNIAESIERRFFLSRLWAEICDLPPRQRCAVLLNLRDERGCSAIELFPLLGVASIRQIAAALEIAPDEFAGLWNELPLDDARIAERLGLTRQQIINLRKSARERLGRRVRDE
jgi:hypothetical protein